MIHATGGKRRPADFYPTPADVTAALIRWMDPRVDGEAWIDPAAGDGAIIAAAREAGPAEAHWSAIELRGECESALEIVAEHVRIGDALAMPWGDAAAVLNPPFGQLDAFWDACLKHHARGHWAAVLTPIAWWCAEKRARYRDPDWVLPLTWRPSFMPKGSCGSGAGHKGSQDFAWCVLEPRGVRVRRTVWERLQRPDRGGGLF